MLETIVISFIVVFLTTTAASKRTLTCNVLEYGAKADNDSDLAPILLKTFNQCIQPNITSNPKDTELLIPRSRTNFTLKSNAIFSAASNFTFRIDGPINIPFNGSLGGTMIQFTSCSNIIFTGTGRIYGNGDLYRPNRNLTAFPGRPRLLRFQNCNGCDISGVTLINSPMFHVTVIGNNNVVHNQRIIADNIGETDGYDISGNNNYVHDVYVQNGDECVTVKTPTNGFKAERLICIGTAGCNIGSFGSGGAAAVENVSYRDIFLKNSKSGILIKSYPNSSGYVRNVSYSNVMMVNVSYPLEIEETWNCGSSCPTATHQLNVSDISFKHIHGTGDNSTFRPLVTVDCAAGVQCQNIVFEDIQLKKSNGLSLANNIQNACGSGVDGLGSC